MNRFKNTCFFSMIYLAFEWDYYILFIFFSIWRKNRKNLDYQFRTVIHLRGQSIRMKTIELISQGSIRLIPVIRKILKIIDNFKCLLSTIKKNIKNQIFIIRKASKSLKNNPQEKIHHFKHPQIIIISIDILNSKSIKTKSTSLYSSISPP